MWSSRAAPMNRQKINWAASNVHFSANGHGCSQTKVPLISSPGATSNAVKRVTRRAKGDRCGFFESCLEELLAPGLEPILFHPPVQGTAAQAQRFRRLAHIALKALQRFAN